MHAEIEVRLPADKMDPSKGTQMVKTTAGRIIVNQYVPDEVPYVNEVLGKKALRKIITNVIKNTGVTRTAKFLLAGGSALCGPGQRDPADRRRRGELRHPGPLRGLCAV